VSEIAVVGMGDSGLASLLPEARALVDGAALLCGGERHLAFFPDHPAERFVIKSTISGLIERLRDETRQVVVLASGDPCFYGIGPLLADRLGRERVRILPNVSSVQLAFARLGLSWQDAVVVSAHGRPLEGVLPMARRAPKVAILTDDRNTPAVIARALLEYGSEDAWADVFEHLGGIRERHVSGRLSDLLEQRFASLNLMVLRHCQQPLPLPLGLPEEAFAHRQGMITKSEVRAVSLARLRLRDSGVLWDVGAGCGSVAIEAAALCPGGQVFAVERDPAQLTYLEENRRRFGAGNVTVVTGQAPDALSELVSPDAVFIGGSGGALEAILRVAMERLQLGGRIILNLVTLEHLEQALAVARTDGWACEVTQISVARSAVTAKPESGEAGGLTRLAALNPVFIVAMEREG
jgi:precorrin-6Y C5,15-methyltransferase (decarboxylating)